MCTPTPLIPTPGKNLTTTEKLITEQKYSDTAEYNKNVYVIHRVFQEQEWFKICKLFSSGSVG